MEFKKGNLPALVVEEQGYEGVRRIAGKVAEDIRKVFGERPRVLTDRELLEEKPSSVILCAALGKSRILEELVREGMADLAGLVKEDGLHKREVYQIRLIFRKDTADDALSQKPAGALSSLPKETENILLICGSDKRGTIYGMFALSEYIGVSALCYWGDAEPLKRERMVIGRDIETISREPSVRYRGFFINDEWPCFGSWVMEHFGGFNAEAYDAVFELLLRLKGNYLWPAMWSASFPLDGPGSKNEELADLYGVVMGYSHHEPCLRASEEWDKVRGEGSRYGNEWNFYTNEQGLLNYWEDALKRSGKYENVITVGMRGERDTSMLGEHSAVSENISLLKDIITKQKELIRRHVKRDSDQIPLMLALYKEVEPYFYGDEQTPGLKDWEGLEGVTCMFCEDNYGYMRTLPGGELRGHKGGFGMYYHLDYHGGPISYEWVDSTPLTRIWEQMSEAYEYGIRDIWIVNVGDLKFHEVPASYFLALAYDYDRWGYGNPDSSREYTVLWAEKSFPRAGAALQRLAGKVLTDYIRINSLRRPEALHAGVYHPCHYGETDRMLAEAEGLEAVSCQVLEELRKLNEQANSEKPEDLKEPGRPEDLIDPDEPGLMGEAGAYYSMVHFPAMASMNLLKLHLYAGKNHHYAAQGRVLANHYGKLVQECIRKDRAYVKEWAAFREGKWNGMQLAQHIGFNRWNEDDYRYPLVMQVEPVHRPRMSVSRKDEERAVTKSFGPPAVIEVPDFQYAGCSRVVLELANGGVGSFRFQITVEEAENRSALPQWLSVSPMCGEVDSVREVVLECDRGLLTKTVQRVRLLVEDGDTKAAVEILGKTAEGENADSKIADSKAADAESAAAGLPPVTFLEQKGLIVISSEHFCRKKDTEKGSFRVLRDYGKHGCGVKVFPSTAVFGQEEERPEVTYRFFLEEAGEYQVDLLTAPSNPLAAGGSVNLMLTGGEGEPVKLEVIPGDFRAGDPGDGRWAGAALDQERRTSAVLSFAAGLQEITLGALDAGVVVEKILIHRPCAIVRESYLGPGETWFTGMKIQTEVTNPITRLDYPDPDVIRAGDTYYMVSTTMHFMPGCEILRSYDLAHWEHMAYVYDRLDGTPGQRLAGEKNIYGKGMWAASLRFHKGVFYICFVANDTGKTYLYKAEDIRGPWEKHHIEGFYHDCSLLFDDDDRVYIAYGNKNIYITELKPDLSGPLEGGLHRLAVSDAGHPGLGYEGTHFYKINGSYYLFFIHSLRDRWMRAEACFRSRSLKEEFTGGDVLVDDMGYLGQGVAQGGIVDTPQGQWYGILFQDRGAVGRIPVLVPVAWEKDYPVFGRHGKTPEKVTVSSTRPGYSCQPLVQGDDFKGEEGLSSEDQRRLYGCFGLKSVWQFNHEPELSLVRLDRRKGELWITGDKLCSCLTQASNILTQRMCYPGCTGEVTVDAGGLKEGDYAGICAFQGAYAFIAVTRRNGSNRIVVRSAGEDDSSGEAEDQGIVTAESRVRLRAEADFFRGKDEVRFFYQDGEEWKSLGTAKKLYFRLDHFTGCRFGLFLYATQETGGRAGFMDFTYKDRAGDEEKKG
ncbi:MAG: glycosyl hydrolase 115 family protein [Acetatifactor sp.]|nr:glycosyl hydrolase 115 family protein [Acetatifactor sp.]